VIRTINGATINQSSDVPPMIGAMTPGTRVELGVLRDGKTRDYTLTLAELNEGLASGAGSRQDQGGEPRGPSAKSSNSLGLIGQDLSADDRRQAGLQSGEGVGIARIEGIAAREAGLQPGDVVLRVGGTAVGSAAALDRALSGVKIGQTVMLLVRRGTSSQFVAVTPRADNGDGDDEG
jgi:serine protease Do